MREYPRLEHILDDMKSVGFSYMLLAGSDKVNFKLLSEELHPYEVEDLLNLERFHSLNLVSDEKGILRPFITKLPLKIDTTLLCEDENELTDSKYKIIDFKQRVV